LGEGGRSEEEVEKGEKFPKVPVCELKGDGQQGEEGTLYILLSGSTDHFLSHI
jgi:hypothetical protein